MILNYIQRDCDGIYRSKNCALFTVPHLFIYPIRDVSNKSVAKFRETLFFTGTINFFLVFVKHDGNWYYVKKKKMPY